MLTTRDEAQGEATSRPRSSGPVLSDYQTQRQTPPGFDPTPSKGREWRSWLLTLAKVAGLVALVVAVLTFNSESSRATQDLTFSDAPGPLTTGVPEGTVLTPSGSIKVTQAGAVVDAMDVTGRIYVAADNVTISNSRVNAAGTSYGIKLGRGVSGLTITDSEIYGARSSAVSLGSFNAYRLNIHSSRDGLLIGSNSVVHSSWIHDLNRGSGIKSFGGTSSTLWGNYIDASSSRGSALMLQAQSRDLADWLVQGNFLQGGRYTINFDSRYHNVSNVQFIDNLWNADSWGRSPVRMRAKPAIWLGNRDSDNDEIDSPMPSEGLELVVTLPPVELEARTAAPEAEAAQEATTSSTAAEGEEDSQALVVTTGPTTTANESATTGQQSSTTAGGSTTSAGGQSTTSAPPTTSAAPTTAAPTTARPTTAAPTTAGPPNPPPAPASWDAAIASKSISTIRNWYIANTGFESFYSQSKGRNLRMEDLERVGSIKVTKDNTVIEGKYITGAVTIQAKNVTIRGSVIDVNGCYCYGVSAKDANAINWKVENVTFTNSKYNSTKNHEHRGNRAIMAYRPGQARFNKTMDGFLSGYRSEASYDQLWEYNFVDRIVNSPGSHNTSFTLRSNKGSRGISNVTIRRNLLLDGTSSAMSFYPRSAEVNRNILVEENIFDIYYPEHTVAYCLYRGAEQHGGIYYRWDNVRWRGNIFGKSTSSTCGKSGNATGQRGTEFSGNRYIDGTPIG